MSPPESEQPGSDKEATQGADGPSSEADSPPPSSSPPSSSGDDEASAEVSAKPEAPVDPLDAAKADAARFRDQLLRTAADFDNFRKRSRRDQEDAQRRGKESVLKELLPVFDNLERATQHADQSTDVAALAEGLRMVLKQWTGTLERMGVRKVESIGVPFDPLIHEAIQHIESNDHPAGVVAAEVQPGYVVGDHLLRAAMVVVSKGPGPSGASAESPSSPDGPGEETDPDVASSEDDAPPSSSSSKG
jgi:molecular chaperone GrpE